MSRAEAFNVLDIDEHHATATAFNMLFCLWCKETRLEAFRRASETLNRLASAHPEGVGACHILDQNALPPSAETRAELSKMIRQGGGGNLKHYSVLYEGTGFKAASIRAVVSAAHMLARASTNLSVFSSLAECAAWHADQQRHLGRLENARDISSVVRQLREAHETYMTKFQG